MDTTPPTEQAESLVMSEHEMHCDQVKDEKAVKHSSSDGFLWGCWAVVTLVACVLMMFLAVIALTTDSFVLCGLLLFAGVLLFAAFDCCLMGLSRCQNGTA